MNLDALTKDKGSSKSPIEIFPLQRQFLRDVGNIGQQFAF